MEKFEQLLAKKLKESKKKMSDVEKEAKGSVLANLKDMAKGLMGDKVKGLKKVTVASDSPEGLKAGLEKAEEVIESEDEKSSEEMEEEGSESEELVEQCKDKSPEEIQELINQLNQLKEEKQEA